MKSVVFTVFFAKLMGLHMDALGCLYTVVKNFEYITVPMNNMQKIYFFEMRNEIRLSYKTYIMLFASNLSIKIPAIPESSLLHI